MKKEKIQFPVTKEMITKGAYWILMKFNADKFHRGLDSAKRDKFGGYLERWLAKIFEKPFFDTLLKKYEKKYSIIYDDLIYKDNALKTAPDVLGLKIDNKLIQFGKYTNTWEHYNGMPKIEIKSFRKDQYVATTNANQTADYYVFLEADLDDDYLKTIFSDNFYDEKNYDEIIKNWKILESLFEDSSSIFKEINKPEKKLEKYNVELLSIMTQEDWINLSTIAKGAVKTSNKITKQPEKPHYFKTIEKNISKTHWAKKNPLGNKDLKNLILDNEERKYLMPIFQNEEVQDGSNGLIADITGSSNSTIYFTIGKAFRLNGKKYNEGDYKMSFVLLDRTSGLNEHCALKDSVRFFDQREKLLEDFDSIVNKSIKDS
jgi:hypothetical protein